MVKPALQPFQFLAVDKVDGRGLSNTVRHALQAKNEVYAVVAIEVGI